MEYSSQLNDIYTCLISLQNAVRHGFAEMNYKFGEIDKKIEEIDRRFEAIDIRFEQVDNRFDKLEKEIDDRFEKSEAKMESYINDAVETLEASRKHDNEIINMRLERLEEANTTYSVLNESNLDSEYNLEN